MMDQKEAAVSSPYARAQAFKSAKRSQTREDGHE